MCKLVFHQNLERNVCCWRRVKKIVWNSGHVEGEFDARIENVIVRTEKRLADVEMNVRS